MALNIEEMSNLKKTHGDMLVYGQLSLLLDPRHHSWQHLARDIINHINSRVMYEGRGYK